MQKLILLIFILITTNQLSKAQGKLLFNKQLHSSIEVKFHPEYPTSTCPNYFIDEIAKAIPKIRMYVTINYQYFIETSILKDGGKYQLKARLGKITHGGNYKYKNFDFSHLVAPQQIEQSYLIKDLSSNTKHYQKIRINFKEGDSAQVDIKGLKGVITYRVFAKVHSVKYIYTEAQKLKFQKAVEDIDTYYDDALKLDALQARIKELDFNKADLVALHNVDLKYIEKDLDRIDIESYKTSLNLDAYDPIRLLPKYDSVAKMIAGYRQVMDAKMGNLDRFYYDQAQKELKGNNEKSALEFYKKSIEVNPYFSPSIYQLSRLDYQHKRYTDCFLKIQHILNDLKPGQEIKKQCIELSKMAYDSVMNICNKLNKEERYNQSIKLLYKTKTFCDSTKYIKCNSEIDQNISKAIYGLYASYLSIASASLNKGRLDMCYEYLAMAKRFKANNRAHLIGESSTAQKITLDLIAGLVEQSDEENRKNNQQIAIELLNKAKELCKQNPANACMSLINKNEAKIHQAKYAELIHQSLHFKGENQAQKRKNFLSLAITYQQLHSDYIPSSIGTDTIIGKVRYMMYQEYISNGIIELNNKNYADAFIEFKEAKKLENKYVFEKNKELDSYLKEAAKPNILKILEDGKLKAWGKYYDEAALLLDSAVNEAKRYNLNTNSDISEATKVLSGLLKNNACDKVLSEYNKWVKKANNSLRFEDYYHAAQFYNKALEVAETSNSCKIDLSQAKSKLSKYQWDIAYKTNLYYADSLESVKPELAFNYYVKAEELRLKYGAEMNSKHNKTLCDVLNMKNNAILNKKGLEYLMEQNRIEDSFKLSVKALKSGQTINIEVLRQLAKLLAAKDQSYGLNAIQQATKRFGNTKELHSFKREYLKASRQ